MPTRFWSRRAVLGLAVASAALAACTDRPAGPRGAAPAPAGTGAALRSARSSEAGTLRLPSLPSPDGAPVPTAPAARGSYLQALNTAVLDPIAKAFHASQRDITIEWVPPAGGSGAEPADAVLVPSGFWVPPNTYADLGPALRARNVDLSALLPGLAGVFPTTRGVIAVPVTYRPQVVWIDTVRLAALDVELPAPGWSLDAFEAFALAVSHSPRGNGAALGGYRPPWVSQVWAAWLLGFGAPLVQDGQIVLDDPGSLAGLDRFATLLKADGFGYDWPANGWTIGPQGRLTDYPTATGPVQFLDTIPAIPSDPSDPSSAPLHDRLAATAIPAMPTASNIPLGVTGLAAPIRSSKVDMIAEFLAWVFGAAGQACLQGVGYPSVLASAGTAWAGNWTKAMPGAVDAGAFQVPASRFRAIPWQIGMTGAALDQAIRDAVHAAPGDRAGILGAAAAAANRSLPK